MNRSPTLSGAPHEIAAALRAELSRLEGARLPVGAAVSSGCDAFDRLLPGGGFARGTLVEWLAADTGSGAGTLALLAAKASLPAGGSLVVFDSRSQLNEAASTSGLLVATVQHFHPPAAAALGIDLENLIVVRAPQERDELWALYQTLRSPGVAAVWVALEQIEWRWFRRLQLAAETGGAVGHLLRPASVRDRPTWSQLQLLVEPRPAAGTGGRRLRVELVRCRTSATGEGSAGKRGGVVELELDDTTGTLREASPHDETHPFALAAELARPAKRRSNKRLAC